MGCTFQPQVTLYGYATSPYVQKVHAFLLFKGVRFNVVHVNPLNPAQIAFTGKRQVPVVNIDGDWKIDSTPIGLWLDRQFPSRPILPTNAAQRELVLAIDRWISDVFIPGMLFRQVLQWPDLVTGLKGGWALAAQLHASRPLPIVARLFWPLLLRRAPFIHRLAGNVDRSEPLHAMRERILATFLEHLDGGPFLGGMSQPTLCDLSLYAVWIQPYLTLPSRYLEGENADELPGYMEFLAWLRRVHSHMPATPVLVGDQYINGDRLSALSGNACASG